jgi:hypothetical protein
LISVQGKRASGAPDRQTDIMVMEEVTKENMMMMMMMMMINAFKEGEV